MPLTTHVTDRFGSASPFLVNLTNHDAPSATTINSTRLAEAATAAEGDFVTEAQVAYDDLNSAHANAGVMGVVAYLRAWSSAQGKSDGEITKFHDQLKRIGKVSSRKRISPVASRRTAQQPGDEDKFYGLSPEFEEHHEDI